MLKTVFISDQISEYKFGALLEISDDFSTKLNSFIYMISGLRLKSLDNFVTILCGFEKRWLISFA